MSNGDTNSHSIVAIPIDTVNRKGLSDDEWRELLDKVRDVHRIMTDLETNVKPALESIAKGGIFSAFMGKRK